MTPRVSRTISPAWEAMFAHDQSPMYLVTLNCQEKPLSMCIQHQAGQELSADLTRGAPTTRWYATQLGLETLSPSQTALLRPADAVQFTDSTLPFIIRVTALGYSENCHSCHPPCCRYHLMPAHHLGTGANTHSAWMPAGIGQ